MLSFYMTEATQKNYSIKFKLRRNYNKMTIKSIMAVRWICLYYN